MSPIVVPLIAADGARSTLTLPDPIRLVKPTITNRGIPAGTKLTPYTGQFGAIKNGDLVLDVAGVTLDAFDIPARVLPRAPDISVLRSNCRGNPALAGNSAVIDCNNANVKNFRTAWSVLSPDKPSLWCNAIIGHDWTMDSCIGRGVDGAGIYNVHAPGAPVNVTMIDSIIPTLHFFSPDPNHTKDGVPTKSHPDCVQIQSGSNIRILRNTFVSVCDPAVGDIDVSPLTPNALGGWNPGYPHRQGNSVLQVTQTAALGPVSDVWFNYNWCDGGAVSLNITSKPLDQPMAKFQVIGNRFGRGQVYAGVAILMHGLAADAVITGNVWDDNSNAVVAKLG